jgi:hypothetical protein
MFYVSLTPDGADLLAIDGMADWWRAINADRTY